MIPLGQEQALGRKTFLVHLSKKTSTSIILIFLALAIGMNKDIFGLKLAPAISTGAFVLLLIAFIMFVIGYGISRLKYKNYTFTLEEFDIKLKKGLFNIEEVSLPYRQIQSVDITRSLAYRFFGVSRLVMITAGNEDDKKDHDETDTVFDPIDADLAEEVRQTLQRKIGVQIIEGTKVADVDATNNSVITDNKNEKIS